MALLYLLQQPIAVDSADAVGHTSLMWAAYQGDALSVELLLKHGASVHARDEQGLTPLHWAVVRGNKVRVLPSTLSQTIFLISSLRIASAK